MAGNDIVSISKMKNEENLISHEENLILLPLSTLEKESSSAAWFFNFGNVYKISASGL